MMPTTGERAPQVEGTSRRRGLRWLVGIPLLMLALAGLGVWRAHSIADATIERHLDSYRAALARLRSAPNSRPALEAPEEPGDAHALVEALGVAVDAIPRADWSVVEEFGTASTITHDPAIERAVIRRIEPSLEALGGLWRRGYVAVPPERFGTQAGLNDVGRSHQVGRALSAAIRLARDAGDGPSAMRLAGDQALVGQDVSRGGTFLTTLVGVAMESGAERAIAETLRRSSLPEESLARLAPRLAALGGTRPALSRVWAVEKTMLEGLLADDAQAPFLLDSSFFGADLPLRTWRTLYSSRIARANSLRALEALPEELPPELSREPRHDALERTLAACGPSADDPILRAYLGPWPILLDRLRERDARHAVLELAVAIARFEAEQGSWPTREADLVPRYLPAIPTSPMDPAGVRFAGNKAWSRGPDGDDDGGAPCPTRTGGRATETSSSR